MRDEKSKSKKVISPTSPEVREMEVSEEKDGRVSAPTPIERTVGEKRKEKVTEKEETNNTKKRQRQMIIICQVSLPPRIQNMMQ